jgi:hypothetical protein
MSMFNWLLIGHLVGDWMLQNDWMARNKQRRWFSPAILVHCTIYTLTLILALWAANRSNSTTPPYLTFSSLIFLSHWLIDAGQLATRWMRWLHQSHLRFVQLMVDQTMHLLVLVILVETILTRS